MSKSSTTIRKKRKPEWIHNPHPGEILLEDLMKPLGLSQNALARALKVSPVASTNWCTASGRFQRIQTCGLRGTLICTRVSFWAFRPTST